jgi:CRP-like cAMP-binding protein
MSRHEYAQHDHPVGRDAKFAGYQPMAKMKEPRLTRADRRALAADLATFDVFRNCEASDLQALANASSAFSFPPGWAMINENTPADSCYAIMRGVAHVYRGNDRVAELGPGSVVGEMAVLTGNLRSATVTTTSRVSGVCVSNERLLKLFRERPRLLQAMRDEFARRSAASGRVVSPAPLETP